MQLRQHCLDLCLGWPDIRSPHGISLLVLCPHPMQASHQGLKLREPMSDATPPFTVGFHGHCAGIPRLPSVRGAPPHDINPGKVAPARKQLLDTSGSKIPPRSVLSRLCEFPPALRNKNVPTLIGARPHAGYLRSGPGVNGRSPLRVRLSHSIHRWCFPLLWERLGSTGRFPVGSMPRLPFASTATASPSAAASASAALATFAFLCGDVFTGRMLLIFGFLCSSRH